MKFRMILVLALVFGLASSLKTQAEDIKILSWNIQMLPAFIAVKTKKHVRAPKIAEVLKAVDKYDVIVFQEAFQHSSYIPIKRALKKLYPYQFGPANRRYITLRVNSGVMILSKYPAKVLDTIIYKYRQTFDDRLARKGAMIIEVNKNGRIFQVAGTHLNAGGDPYIRKLQVVAMKMMMAKHERDGVPQFAVGDFNIGKFTEPELYNFTVHALKMQDGPILGPWQFTVDYVVNSYYRHFNRDTEQSVIDYIFSDFKGVPTKTVERRIPDLRYPGWYKKAPEIADLSDHLPLELVATL